MILYTWAGQPVYAAGHQEKRVPCEVYSRIVGYYRPVRNWNKAKKQEFKERRPYAQPLRDPRSE